MPGRERWEQYRNSRIRAKLPGAKNYAKCDICGPLEVEMDALRRHTDPHSISLRQDISRRKVHTTPITLFCSICLLYGDCNWKPSLAVMLMLDPACCNPQEEHTAEHQQERYYAHDIWTKSESQPEN
eukprot:5735228-Pleurochrysis_carterae.AAC.1